MAVPLDIKDRKTLLKVALTSMSSKAVGSAREHLAEISIDAVTQIAEQRGDKTIADIDNIQLVKKTGKSLLETQLIQGIIIDKEVVSPGMPKIKENAKIALLDSALEIEKTEITAEIRIKDPITDESVPRPRNRHDARHGYKNQSLRRRRNLLPKRHRRHGTALPIQRRHNGSTHA